MKNLLGAAIFFALAVSVPAAAAADVSVRIGIPLPPAIVYAGPIEVIVIPDTYLYDVYVVPDLEVEIFFCRGWWWRLWEGRWYRSRHFDRGWVYYRYIPDFYYDIHPHWRTFYKDGHWHGHPWNYQRIPHHQLEHNWRNWNSHRYWERERRWDVERYQPLPAQTRQKVRHQREYEYRRKPDVRKHEQWKLQQQDQPRRREMKHQEQRRQSGGEQFKQQQRRRPDVREYQRQDQKRNVDGRRQKREHQEGQPDFRRYKEQKQQR